MTRLTPRQIEVLAFIRRFIAERGFAPTLAEIAAGLGFRSANASAQHVRLLVKKGALAVDPGVARSLRVLEAKDDFGDGASNSSANSNANSSANSDEERGLPLIGEVAAGQPILAQEQIEGRVDVPGKLFQPGANYLLRVRGDSMIDAGLLPGDLVAVHRQSEARDGQMVVVRLADEVTVKYWKTPDNIVRLVPANANYEPIEVDPRRESVEIEGLVVGVLRLGSKGISRT
ncbi:MAG: transcriptional repressor LexA [Planctomycetota bacterium]